MEILDDPEREFAASVFLQLEVLPQAIFNKRVAESAALPGSRRRWLDPPVALSARGDAALRRPLP